MRMEPDKKNYKHDGILKGHIQEIIITGPLKTTLTKTWPLKLKYGKALIIQTSIN